MDEAARLIRTDASPVQIALPVVAIRAERILRIHGYGDLQRVRPRIRKAADYAAALGATLASGQVALRRLPVIRLEAGTLELAGEHRLHSAAFQRFLAGCRSVLVFVLTAGDGFEREVAAHMDAGRPVEGLFLDAAGWLAVESVTRQLVDALKRESASMGLRLTRRLGPGYSYRLGEEVVSWALEEQRGLFEALDDDLPVRLLESSAMEPKMSRSGLYGLRAAGRGRR